MKNTKFRRRALVSSVAMLLVALVALGSATFAWFTANPDAATNSLTLKATSSLGLVVQSQTEKGIKADKWSHDAILHAKATSATDTTPVADPTAIAIGAASQDAGTGNNKGIYTIPAAADHQFNADDTKEVSASVGDATGGNHYEEKLYMKVTGSTSATVTLRSVAINSVGTTTLAKALRVAILDKNGKLIGIFKPSGGTDNKYLSATGTYAQSADPYSATAAGATANLTVGTVDDSGNDYITIRAFLDGEDQYVYSQNIQSVDMTQVMSGLVVNLHAD